MKLEGAGGGPFQTIMLIGIEDPDVLADVDGFLARMARGLRERLDAHPSRRGWDHRHLASPLWLERGVGPSRRRRNAAPPREIGLMFVATAPTQAMATEAARVCNPHFLPLPGPGGQRRYRATPSPSRPPKSNAVRCSSFT